MKPILKTVRVEKLPEEVDHLCSSVHEDRYYQEVGRGGRDGRASLSLAVYTEANLADAAQLNRERIITAKRGLERWEAMLLSRIHDPRGSAQSEGAFGRKVFLFTDALDVTNRLFFDLRDAEGEDSWGNPDRLKPEGSLANLRSPTGPDAALRFAHGQSWDLCTWIGQRLRPDDLLGIGRTTSQDAGVDADADVIVATAALEVGFNDSAVGRQRTHTRLLDMLAQPVVRAALEAAAAVLWEPPGPAWDEWLTQTLLSTVGAAAPLYRWLRTGVTSL